MEQLLGELEDAVVWTDAEGSVLWCNRAFDLLAGREHLFILGAPLGELLLLKFEGSLLDLLRTLQAAPGGSLDCRCELPGPSGARVLRVRGIARGAGPQAGFLWTLHDATAEVRAAEAALQRTAELAEARERLSSQSRLLESVLTNLGEGVVVADTGGKFLVWNPMARRLVGIGPTDAAPAEWSRRYGVFLPDRTTPYPSDKLPLALAIRGQSTDSVGLFIRNPEMPEGILLSVTGRPLVDESGAIAGGVVLFRDVTAERKAQEEARERTERLDAVNKELDAFTYSVSHDLRAPLRAIEGFSKILLEEHSGGLDAEGNRLFQVVRTNTLKMGRLIDDLLAFSRLGKTEIERRQVDMEDLARSVLKDLEGIPEPAGRVRIESLPPVWGDPSMLRQAFLNLLANAVKFTRRTPKPSIRIGARREDGGNVYFVQDNGAGFDMRYQDKLFGIFQRLHTDAEFEGTGVGLAIVRRIAERHGGRAWAEGKPGEGATFYLSLPSQGG